MQYLFDQVVQPLPVVLGAFGRKARMWKAVAQKRVIFVGFQRLGYLVICLPDNLHDSRFAALKLFRKIEVEDFGGARVVAGDDAAHQPPRHDLRQSRLFQHAQVMPDSTRSRVQPVGDLLGRGGLILDDIQDARASRVADGLELLQRVDNAPGRKIRHSDRHIIWQERE